ncbi:GNAT family N-acetyltransferase [Flavobacterium sp.]|uniref:GNAT family N-acetyltransferase n=1 Tax=Flavobacterium sp. TaxID=239 RepID=UPI0025F08CD7|nr:GNAT family N-acetyltransferase [Flavobacterium sp.]
MNYHLRKANASEVPQIWDIIQQAIIRRKNDGSEQWQDGYPNETFIQQDIEKQIGYVIIVDDTIAGYAVVLFNDEPEYEKIRGKWLTNDDFAVLHRVAISDEYLGKGLAQKIFLFTEVLAIENNIFSIKVDTNFDNIPMLRILKKLGYIYCGEVTFRGGARKAFEKKLTEN